ncbi:MAG TPA: tRNA (adenosine(37)-N6)-threonylcarbamoyltransferase complex ATPase subunit type 1 TsaE [Chitinophagales bacterium]|nr:tRNA (adenosine(37)-N6)-threonylcarbamoyltransferase complex ATPase subunit type 1 TsaE [Chitinophagales bacterium]
MRCKDYRYELKDLQDVAKDLLLFAGNTLVWTFTGELGAGKTTLIKEIAEQLGSSDTVSSPTYTIVNQYLHSKGNIFHIDAYRLEDEEEAFQAGIEEIIDSGDFVWIEWPQKIENLLPEQILDIQITVHPEHRTLTATLKGN